MPESWRWSERALEVFQLRGDVYERTDTSRFFGEVRIAALAAFVERGLQGAAGDVALAREFRAWLRREVDGEGR